MSSTDAPSTKEVTNRAFAVPMVDRHGVALERTWAGELDCVVEREQTAKSLAQQDAHAIVSRFGQMGTRKFTLAA